MYNDPKMHELKKEKAIPVNKKEIAILELQNLLGNAAKIGQGKVFKNKWITKNENNLINTINYKSNTYNLWMS